MCDLLIVDCQPIFYNIDFVFKNYQRYSLESLVKLTVLEILTGSLFGDLNISEFRCVFLTDMKPYWRHPLLSKYGVNYKDNRKRNPLMLINIQNMKNMFNQFLLDYKGVQIVDLISSKIIDGQNYGFEADDLAAGIIKKFSANYDNVYCLTVDSDWLPFTSYENVTWLNLNNYAPRIRNAEIALEWCKNHKLMNNTILKRNFKWESILDLWKHKSKFGDASDNIRGDIKDQSPGRYEPFVDLFNPHPSFQCWKERNFYTALKFGLTETIKRRITTQQFLEMNDGVPLTINPFSNT